MADEVASLLVKITADGTQAVGVLNGVASTVETLANKNASLLNKVSSVGTLAGNVGRVMTKTFGVATVAGLVASAKAAGQLNKELANIGTLSVPTERLKEFKGQIQDVAIATGKSTSDISEGTYQVISAFGDAPDTMEKVEINAKAATAGLATTADSIALTSAVTKAYGDTSAGATQQVADLAFKTVELGQTTFPELAQNMQQVTSLSKELGVSQEELFGAYATLTGVTGNAAEVQTQMKAVYTALLKPSDNMQAAIEKIGYSSGFTMIKTLGFAGTLNALKSATNGSEEQMLGLFNNVRAMPAVMALTGAQSDIFAEKLEKMKNASGAATKAFEVQTEGVAKTGFTLEQAKVKMQVAAQNFGESAAPMIADFADIVDKVSTRLSTMSDEERKAIINTGVLTTKIGVGLSVGGKALTLGTKLVGTAKAIGPAVISGITSPVGLATLAIAGLGIAGKVAYDRLYEAEYQWANGMNESAAAISKNAAEVTKLSDLKKEVSELKLIINSPESSKEQVENAQQRIKEIAELLAEEYDLKINADTSAVESALNLLSMEKRRDFMDSGSDYLETMRVNRDDYIKAPEKIESLDRDLSKLNQQKLAYEDIASSLGDLKRGYDAGTVSQKDYLDGFVALLNKAEKTDGFDGWELPQGIVGNEDLATGLQNALTFALNLEKMIETLGGEYASTKEKYDSLTIAQSEYEKSAEAAAQGYSQVMASDILNGNWGDVAQVSQAFKTLGKEMKAAGADTDGVAKEFATAKQGLTDFQQAIEAGAGDAMANDFIEYKKSIGDTAEEAIKGAALIKTGFSEVSQVTAEKLPEVINNLKSLGQAQGIDMTADKLTELAHSMGLIAENKHIEIAADGKVTIKVDDSEVKDYNPDDKDAKAKYHPDSSEVDNWNPPEKRGTVIYDAVMPEQFKGTNYGKFGANVFRQARGTQNFSGGLAMVNDERGISDNRELIVDRGRAFIPEGRDVILPLSKGAKVYTAAQTKAIMSGLGIPHYAKGKDNSDAFIAAKNDWTQYKNTHAVTVTQELQKWVELLEKFTSNQKDVQDIQEQIFSLMQKQTKELNDQAKAYLEERSALNDWEDIGDSPLAAFGRVKERNMEEVKAGRQTWDDFTKTMKDMGYDMYNARISQSKKWLDHEEKYNGMSVADTLAGIDRMRSYTQEYYEQGIISHREFVESKTELDEMYIDKVKEGLSEQFDISKAYISDHTYFNDWQDSGDDPLEAYNRVMDRHRESLANGDLTQKEFDEYSQKLGSSMYSERKEQSLNWLEEQRKYFGMTDEEYVQGLERIKAYTQEYYDQGLISRREYNEAMTELNHSAWDEASEAYDDMLKEQQDYINKMQEEFQKQEQALRDRWEVEDRKIDMATVQGQLDIYAGAVTDRGQQKYKELEEQMKQLQRDEELYQLQVKNTATIDALQADYEQLEADKAVFLKNIVTNTDINVSGIVGDLTSKIAGTGDNITNMLGQLLSAFQNFKVEQSYYNDNSQTTINAADNVDVMAVVRKNAGLDR